MSLYTFINGQKKYIVPPHIETLMGNWYLCENDNKFEVYHDLEVIDTYNSFSKGCGKLQVSSKEYFIYEGGSGDIYAIDNKYNKTLLLLPSDNIKSIFCANNKLYTINGNTTSLTLSEYKLFKNDLSISLNKINQKTTNIPTFADDMVYAAVKIDESNVYVCQYQTSSSTTAVRHCTIKVNLTNDDFTFDIINDTTADTSIIENLANLGTLKRNNTEFYFYNPFPNGLSANISISTSSASITIYKDKNVLYTYNIPISGATSYTGYGKLFFDTDGSGNGYLIVATSNSSKKAIGYIFRLENGKYTQISSKTTTYDAASTSAANNRYTSGYYPWYGQFCGLPIIQGLGSISSKYVATTTSITSDTSNKSNSYNGKVTFGNTIKWP